MAVIRSVILTVLSTSCVLSQSTIDENESPTTQLIASLAQQHQQLVDVVSRLLDHQQQQLNKLNELHAVLTNRLAHCSIEVLAYAGNSDGTPRNGYVKLNAEPVYQASWYGTFPNLRGVNTILVDPFTCSLRESRRFDTFHDPNAATELSNYIRQVSRGNIIVGISADEPSRLLANALPTLSEMGADVADVQSRGSFGFVAQKGFPNKTVLRKVLTEAESLANQPHFNVTVTGCSVDDFSITIV